MRWTRRTVNRMKLTEWRRELIPQVRWCISKRVVGDLWFVVITCRVWSAVEHESGVLTRTRRRSWLSGRHHQCSAHQVHHPRLEVLHWPSAQVSLGPQKLKLSKHAKTIRPIFMTRQGRTMKTWLILLLGHAAAPHSQYPCSNYSTEFY